MVFKNFLTEIVITLCLCHCVRKCPLRIEVVDIKTDRNVPAY